MSRSGRTDRGPSIEGSNVPGNPLRSYRMSMLAHGFVDSGSDDEFALDETDPMSYSVVRIRKAPVTVASVIAAVILLLLIGAVVLLASQ